MSYKTIVGLEIHTELKTNTKAFCSCSNEFGGEPNTNVCPVCLGLPGALPVLNERVVEYAIKAGIATNCNINAHNEMDRKNYFYPDLRKGYQISQADYPICTDGYVEIATEEGSKKIRIQRIQMEEDTGKSLHTEDGSTLMDYNRSGVPLTEIVTLPDMNSGEEAKLFLEKLKSILKFIDVSDCKMEEGSLRCDVNINVVDNSTGEKTKISEIKNMSSFRAVVKAIEFEEKRHITALQNGETLKRETRRWDEMKAETVPMREKLGVADYRFAPDGDLPKMILSEQYIADISGNLPELPDAKRDRFIVEYNISEYDASVLTQSRELSSFYELVASITNSPVITANWINGEILRRLNEDNLQITDLKFSAEEFAALIKYVENGKLNGNSAKKVLREMFETGANVDTIIDKQGLTQISDTGFIDGIVDEVLANNEQSIIDLKNGKDRAFGFLVGQVMKASKGKANPQLVNEVLKNKLTALGVNI